MTDHTITIRFTPDGFSFSADHFCEVTPGPDFTARLCHALLEQLPSGTDAELRCEVETTRLLLLPPDVQDEAVIHAMYHATLSRPEREEQILTQPLMLPKTSQQLTLCFGMDRELYQFLMRNYGDPLFLHPIATMLADADRMTQGNCLVTRCTAQFLEVALFRGPQLMLCNCYRTTQADTRSYYVMNTWLQQGLDQLQDYLLVLGQGNEGLQIRASLHRFIKHVFS